jgi:diguanylate cyclase (GGDEF)-like protein
MVSSPQPPAPAPATTPDPITGVLSREELDAVAAQLKLGLAQMTRRQASTASGAFAVIVVDLDHFRKVNDQFGFQSGDKVIKALVGLMKSVLRQMDSVTRLDGEKFCVLLPGASAANAARVAERIRAEFNATPVVFAGVTSTLSLSAGVADNGSDAGSSLDAVIDRADVAMQQAKEAGRNRVVVFAATSAS